MKFEPLPLSLGELDDYYRAARRFRRSLSRGNHLLRRRGESLEFHDFAQYTLGDDLRHVDWRATMRRGAATLDHQSLVLRRYTAEEQLRIILSLDTRPTMMLPVIEPTRGAGHRPQPGINISKLQVGRWLVEALSNIILEHADRVILHQLFGDNGLIDELIGRNAADYLPTTLDDVCQPARDARPNLSELDRFLPPTAVWVIISDYYFDLANSRSLFDKIADAYDRMCWVIVVDLNSWPYERHLLTSGAPLFKIQEPDVGREKCFAYTRVGAVDAAIAQHRQAVADEIGARADYVEWAWPGAEKNRQQPIEDKQQFSDFFRELFRNDGTLRSIFEPDL